MTFPEYGWATNRRIWRK